MEPAEFIATYCKESWQAGERAWFEYHCNEAHDSDHAEWWYRSHQQVTVVGDADHDGHWGTMLERADGGTPKLYNVRWDDGFEGAVFEDELLTDPAAFERPEPPKGPDQ